MNKRGNTSPTESLRTRLTDAVTGKSLYDALPFCRHFITLNPQQIFLTVTNAGYYMYSTSPKFLQRTREGCAGECSDACS